MSPDDENRWIGECLASAAFKPRAVEQERKIIADIVAGRSVGEIYVCMCSQLTAATASVGTILPNRRSHRERKFGAVIAAADTTDAPEKFGISGVPTAAA